MSEVRFGGGETPRPGGEIAALNGHVATQEVGYFCDLCGEFENTEYKIELPDCDIHCCSVCAFRIQEYIARMADKHIQDMAEKNLRLDGEKAAETMKKFVEHNAEVQKKLAELGGHVATEGE